jgi:hypothetical protein
MKSQVIDLRPTNRNCVRADQLARSPLTSEQGLRRNASTEEKNY